MKKIIRFVGIGFLLLMVGCASSGLPGGARVVGGGLQIRWSPPQDGTGILVETKSGKKVSTQTINQSGKDFNFDATTPQDRMVLEQLFGGVPKDGDFVLYFVPEEKK